MTSHPEDWLISVLGGEWLWYAKRLSANDTLATGAHQAGPYIPKDVVFSAFPSLRTAPTPNPRVELPVTVDSHGFEHTVSAIWYNQRTRNEARITGWGGKTSPLLDPDSTGSLCFLAFRLGPDGDATACRVWLCQTVEEEASFEARIGRVDPGTMVSRVGGQLSLFTKRTRSRCRLAPHDLPREWKESFPNGADLVEESIARRQDLISLNADHRLVGRRACEFELFQSVEDCHLLPQIAEGFKSVDDFLDVALAASNRRKARSGRSLELQARSIFDEERLSYAHDRTTEGRKRPDFLFPSIDAYFDSTFPADRIVMLGVKTTCKYRWRQILTEADRVDQKHLLTVQEGVSARQHDEMVQAGITLVVPAALHKNYPASVRPHLLSLADFIVECAQRTRR